MSAPVVSSFLNTNTRHKRKCSLDFFTGNFEPVPNITSLQCYCILSDILVKNELCIPLERGSNVIYTGKGFICLSPHSKLKIAVLFCYIYKRSISVSAIVFLVIFIQWPMVIKSRDLLSSVSYCSIYRKSLPLELLVKFAVTSLT